eukprot:ANDGO_01184.mRNA.1 hypothetical protein
MRTPFDVQDAGREVHGYGEILFEEAEVCICSENAYFVFWHRFSKGRLYHSVSVDLGNFTGGTIHTYLHYTGMSSPVFDVARIPGAFEAYITEGYASNNFPISIRLFEESVCTITQQSRRCFHMKTGCARPRLRNAVSSIHTKELQILADLS